MQRLIHLGSSNILLEPNDQYLCIVPSRSGRDGVSENLYLPFAGDAVLSIILAKAFLLAEDTKIRDTTIILQPHFPKAPRVAASESC